MCRPTRLSVLSWQRSPLIEHTVPEKEEVERTITVASIRNRKYTNALVAASGLLLNVVWTSSSATLMSTNPIMKSTAEYVLQVCSMSVLSTYHRT